MKKLFTLLCISFFVLTSFAQWTAKASMPSTSTLRIWSVAFTVGNKAYIGTGQPAGGGLNLKDFYQYDQTTNTWSLIAPLPGAARRSAVAFSIGNYGYVGTGYGGGQEFYRYDPSTNTWDSIAPFPGSARYSAVGFSINGKGYVGTGYNAANHDTTDFYEYNPSTNTWAVKAPFPGSARHGAVAFTVGNKGYVGTGGLGSSTSLLTDLYAYDPGTNSWSSALAPLPAGPRVYAISFAIGTKGYVGTGVKGSSPFCLDDFYEYTPATNQWATVSTTSAVGRTQGVGFSLNGKGYITTGTLCSTQFGTRDLMEFIPLSTGINEEARDKSFSIYPNPANNQLFIETNGTEIEQINIYNTTGSLVSQTKEPQNKSIDVSQLATGVYIAEIKTKEGSARRRWMKM